MAIIISGARYSKSLWPGARYLHSSWLYQYFGSTVLKFFLILIIFREYGTHILYDREHGTQILLDLNNISGARYSNSLPLPVTSCPDVFRIIVFFCSKTAMAPFDSIKTQWSCSFSVLGVSTSMVWGYFEVLWGISDRYLIVFLPLITTTIHYLPEYS